MATRIVVFSAVLLGSAALAQPNGPERAAFEVASVKLSPPPPSAGACRPGGKNNPGSLSQCHPLKDLIQLAYGVREFQIAGGPAWIATDWFEIQARTSGAATEAQMIPMLATLLVDRFQLAFHRETRIVPVYALIAAKSGPKVGPQFHPAKAGGSPPTGGGYRWRTNMEQFANIVTNTLRYPLPNSEGDHTWLPVVDRTGLTGDYDIVVDLQPGRDWFAMLPNQLGLKLEARKEPADVIVIDRAVKPSAN